MILLLAVVPCVPIILVMLYWLVEYASVRDCSNNGGSSNTKIPAPSLYWRQNINLHQELHVARGELVAKLLQGISVVFHKTHIFSQLLWIMNWWWRVVTINFGTGNLMPSQVFNYHQAKTILSAYMQGGVNNNFLWILYVKSYSSCSLLILDSIKPVSKDEGQRSWLAVDERDLRLSEHADIDVRGKVRWWLLVWCLWLR